jgi:hypothetical protein
MYKRFPKIIRMKNCVILSCNFSKNRDFFFHFMHKLLKHIEVIDLVSRKNHELAKLYNKERKKERKKEYSISNGVKEYFFVK